MAQSSTAVAQNADFPYKRALRPIDLVHLAKQCLGDEQLEYEILRLFDTTVKSYFARFELASSADDLVMSLHSIKGAASGVGAFTVSDLAKSCEAEVRAGRPLSPERAADLGIAIEEVRTFIARMLSNELA